MGIYTKGGDSGRTSLLAGARVSKTDPRIELLGTVDELNSAIGLAKAAGDGLIKEELSKRQRTLMKLMSGVADPRNRDYKFREEEAEELEKAIDRMEGAFPRKKDFVLYGGCELSARLDMARAIVRRAERRYYKVAEIYGGDVIAMKYLNRLSDYLYVYARLCDHNEGV